MLHARWRSDENLAVGADGRRRRETHRTYAANVSWYVKPCVEKRVEVETSARSGVRASVD